MTVVVEHRYNTYLSMIDIPHTVTIKNVHEQHYGSVNIPCEC
jgi:hypothetical protein